MMLTWASVGRTLAGLSLAMTLSACSNALPAGMALGTAWPVGNGLSDGSKSGTGEVTQEPSVQQPAFVGLYQTAQGPMLLRENKLYSLDTGVPVDWGKAPREGMAWSLAMLSAQEGWSVGSEGIARYRNQLWEPIINSTHELLAPASNNGVAVQLTDVAFANAGRGYAVGTHGMVLAYDGTAWSRLTDALLVGRHFGTVRLTSASDVWVAGEDVLRFDGNNWESIGLPEAGAAVGGLLLLPDAVWASTGDALWRWDRMSRTWSKPQPDLVDGYVGAPQPVPGSPGAVVAWAMDVGSTGGILYRLGAAGSWERVTLAAPPQVELDSLVMLDADTGFALSFDGSALYKFDQGSWSRLSF